MFPDANSKACTQRLQYPLIREYTLNLIRVPIIILRHIPQLRDNRVSGCGIPGYRGREVRAQRLRRPPQTKIFPEPYLKETTGGEFRVYYKASIRLL